VRHNCRVVERELEPTLGVARQGLRYDGRRPGSEACSVRVKFRSTRCRTQRPSPRSSPKLPCPHHNPLCPCVAAGAVGISLCRPVPEPRIANSPVYPKAPGVRKPAASYTQKSVQFKARQWFNPSEMRADGGRSNLRSDSDRMALARMNSDGRGSPESRDARRTRPCLCPLPERAAGPRPLKPGSPLRRASGGRSCGRRRCRGRASARTG
jgi:hypothetical protein